MTRIKRSLIGSIIQRMTWSGLLLLKWKLNFFFFYNFLKIGFPSVCLRFYLRLIALFMPQITVTL